MHFDAPLAVQSANGKRPGTRVFQITGPLTLDNLFVFQNAVQNGELPATAILDLSGVPYIDSAGMGAIVNYYVHCQRLGTLVILAGIGNRPMELFILAKVHTIIPMAGSVEEAEQQM